MEIRRMGKDDILAVAALEKKCFSRPWSREVLEAEMLNRGAVFFVAYEQSSLQGYIGMHAVMDEGYIANVAVEEDVRRQGVASRLMEALLRYCEEHKLGFVTLEARESNAPAISFYMKNGFRQVGRRKNYYASPEEDAVLMTKYFTYEKN